MLDEHQFRIVGVNPVGKFAIGDEEHLIDPRSITLYSSKPVAENIHFPKTSLPLISLGTMLIVCVLLLPLRVVGVKPGYYEVNLYIRSLYSEF